MPKKAIPASKEGEVRSGNGRVQISVRPLGSIIQAVLAELSQFRVQCFWCWVKGRKAWGFSSTGFLKKGDTQGRQSLRKRNPRLSLFFLYGFSLAGSSAGAVGGLHSRSGECSVKGAAHQLKTDFTCKRTGASQSLTFAWCKQAGWLLAANNSVPLPRGVLRRDGMHPGVWRGLIPYQRLVHLFVLLAQHLQAWPQICSGQTSQVNLEKCHCVSMVIPCFGE